MSMGAAANRVPAAKMGCGGKDLVGSTPCSPHPGHQHRSPGLEEPPQARYARFGLLMIALGLSTLAGSLIFKLCAAVQAGRRDVFRSR